MGKDGRRKGAAELNLSNVDMKQFCKERDEALLSLDREKIMSYARKYGVRFNPSNELVFWASVHKAILGIRNAPQKQKAKSAKWLVEHGFKAEF